MKRTFFAALFFISLCLTTLAQDFDKAKLDKYFDRYADISGFI